MSPIISGLKWLATVIFLYTLFSFITLSAQQKYRLYLDADFSGARASSHAIKQGVTTALAEVDHTLQGFQFELVLKNHRANSLRSRRNLEAFLADEQGLLVFSGLHSPPLLANKSFINKNRILLLDPWAAAGPITRSYTSQNWIFRLSIDDSKAGIFISQQALQQGFKKPYLLLEDTGWGRSNSKTMSQALRESAVEPIGLSWFNWGISKNVAKVLLREIKASGADVIFFVGNSNEGVTFIQAMAELPKSIHLPVRSHWGITGGNFIHQVSPLQRQQIDLQFIQTKFSFVNENLPILAKRVVALAIKSNHDIKSKKDIKASTGFIHAYDLTKIMIKAIEQVKLTGDKSQDSHLIHQALENLSAPVYGLLKKYNRPFKPYSKSEADAHEALSIEDYAMGQFDNNDNVILLD
jgi:branched-chain amino acid transport system substrate-binding protein